MNYSWYVCIALVSTFSMQAVVFQGIVENGVTKNNFLCSGDAVNIDNCISADLGSIDFDVSGGKMLQLFNDQAGWLLLQAVAKQYLNQDLRYSGSSLDHQMELDGWSAMGGYCLLITTNSLITDLVKPELIAQSHQEKIVVQLWYNGDQDIQLWSQDAMLLNKKTGFKVVVSADFDELAELSNNLKSSSNSLRLSFLSQLGIQSSNRKTSVYQSAIYSPRSVKVQSS